MKTIDCAQLDNWKDQSLDDFLKWHHKQLARETDVKTAYSAGFDDGWNEAIKMLKLHADLPLTYGGGKAA